MNTGGIRNECVFRLPSLSYDDFDLTGRPSPWRLSHKFETYQIQGSIKKQLPGNQQLLDADLLNFVLWADLHIHEAFYKIPKEDLFKHPVQIDFKLNSVGSSSYVARGVLKDEVTGNTLAYQDMMNVGVDKVSRRPKKLPPEFFRLNDEHVYKTKSPKYNRFDPSALCKVPFIYEFVSSETDVDLNMHITRNVYIRQILNCFSQAFFGGHFPYLKENLGDLKFKRCKFLHLGDYQPGQQVAIHIYEDRQNSRVFYFTVEKERETIAEAVIEFHPQCRSKM